MFFYSKSQQRKVQVYQHRKYRGGTHKIKVSFHLYVSQFVSMFVSRLISMWNVLHITSFYPGRIVWTLFFVIKIYSRVSCASCWVVAERSCYWFNLQGFPGSQRSFKSNNSSQVKHLQFWPLSWSNRPLSPYFYFFLHLFDERLNLQFCILELSGFPLELQEVPKNLRLRGFKQTFSRE